MVMAWGHGAPHLSLNIRDAKEQLYRGWTAKNLQAIYPNQVGYKADKRPPSLRKGQKGLRSLP